MRPCQRGEEADEREGEVEEPERTSRDRRDCQSSGMEGVMDKVDRAGVGKKRIEALLVPTRGEAVD